MPNLLPISISAVRGNYLRYAKRQKSKKFLAICQKVFVRDKYSCRYCGFQSKKFNSVVNIDGDYTNNKGSNFATACCLCSQCFFIDTIGQRKGTGGLVVHIPEISQADLNHLARALFCSMLKNAPYKGKLQSIYLSLKDRKEDVINIFGPGSDSPAVLGQSIIDSGIEPKNLNKNVMGELRILPIKKYFETEITYWKSTTFSKIPL